VWYTFGAGHCTDLELPHIFSARFTGKNFVAPHSQESGERPKSFGEEIGQSLLLSTGVFRFQIGSDRVQIELIVQN